MTTVRATRDTLTGDARVEFRYDLDLLTLLKETVPSRHRTWDRDAKVWTISWTYAPDFIIMARHAGHAVEDRWTANVPPPRQPRDAAAGWAEQLLDAVGPDRREAVFRALAPVLHPDKATGDTVLMQQLNAARDQRGARR